MNSFEGEAVSKVFSQHYNICKYKVMATLNASYGCENPSTELKLLQGCTRTPKITLDFAVPQFYGTSKSLYSYQFY